MCPGRSDLAVVVDGAFPGEASEGASGVLSAPNDQQEKKQEVDRG
jgi:hypothetical protein